MGTTSLLILVAVAGGLGFWFVTVIVRRPLIGLVVGLALWTIEIMSLPDVVLTEPDGAIGVGASVGPFRVSVMDVAALFLLGAVLFELLGPGRRGASWNRRVPPAFGVALFALSVLWVYGLYRGVQEFGIQSAVNGGRQMLYLLTFVAFGAVFGRRMTRRLRPYPGAR